MNIKTLTIIAVITLLAAGGGFLLGQRLNHATPDATKKPERNVLYWYDPMVPGQRFDKPGKSPFMDMQLVPRYADEEKAAAGVGISAQQQQNLGMKTATVALRHMTTPFSAFATLSVDERGLTTLPAPAAGVITKLYARAPQQQVKAGEALAQLWIPQWTTAQQEYLALRQLGDAALTRVARERLALQFMPEATVAALERSGKPQTTLTLRAPDNGYITKLEAREGAQVTATAPLFEIARLDPVWLVVDYPQTQAQSLTPGMDIVALSESWPGERFHGKVSEILPQLDAATRTLKARIVLDNPGHKLKPGMFLSVTRANESRGAPVLAVPEEAVINTGTTQRLLLATGEGHFRPVTVSTGMTSEGWTEIRAGVKEGDVVVTSGQFLIDSEASLRSVMPEVSQ